MIREEENSKHGLIILEALYGDVVSSSDKMHSKGYAGNCVDVTIPLQTSVRNSTLIVHGGGSKSWLEGFYDPNDDAIDNCLYIKYKFLDRLHHCMVADDEELCLPMQEHLIEDDDEEQELDVATPNRKRGSLGRKRSSNRMKSGIAAEREMMQIKANRRRNFLLGLSGLFIGVGVYYAAKWKWISLQFPTMDSFLYYFNSIVWSKSPKSECTNATKSETGVQHKMDSSMSSSSSAAWLSSRLPTVVYSKSA
jgi:hypothetical protein